MTFSIAMTSVDRPYRHHTFLRLVETGTLEHPLVRGFHIAYNRLPNPNTIHVLEQALLDEADWILFLEDDIEIVDDFLSSTDRWLTDFSHPNIHFYPLGCGVRSALHRARAQELRSWDWPVRNFYGATAVALRPAFAAAFCDAHRQQSDWLMPIYGLDENLKRAHQRLYPEQAFIRTPVPCLIDHRGAVTSQTMANAHWTGQYQGWEGVSVRYP